MLLARVCWEVEVYLYRDLRSGTAGVPGVVAWGRMAPCPAGSAGSGIFTPFYSSA